MTSVRIHIPIRDLKESFHLPGVMDFKLEGVKEGAEEITIRLEVHTIALSEDALRDVNRRSLAHFESGWEILDGKTVVRKSRRKP